jgi:CheY-like chemotaxis protein
MRRTAIQLRLWRARLAALSQPLAESLGGSSSGRVTPILIYTMSVSTESGSDSPSPRTARILVVDDDDAVRRSLTRALRLEGHVVAAAASGEEALEVLRSGSDGFDVVISDVMMRGMSGVALCQRIQTLHPSTRVILISGYPGSHFSDQSLSVEHFDLIPKPFTPAQLAERVQAVLAANGPR